MAESINERVKRCRKLACLTQAQVAEKMGMKCSTYSQMERMGNISASRLVKLAKIFNVDTELLLNGDADNINKNEENVAKSPDVLRQEPFYKTSDYATVFVPTNNEINIIKIIRNLPKKKRDEVMAYIEKAYKDNKNRNK